MRRRTAFFLTGPARAACRGVRCFGGVTRPPLPASFQACVEGVPRPALTYRAWLRSRRCVLLCVRSASAQKSLDLPVTELPQVCFLECWTLLNYRRRQNPD